MASFEAPGGRGTRVNLEDTEAQTYTSLNKESMDGSVDRALGVKKGSWFDKDEHPSIRKRAAKLEFEYIDSGGSWTYQDWRNHQSWSRCGPERALARSP